MDELAKLFATAEPAGLGPGPRPGVLSESESNRAVAGILPKAAGEDAEALRALVLLWHDHLTAAHVIAQGIENADGAFVHGIVHRREPDYGNAGYWFRRVGQHPAFPEIARRAGEFLAAQKEAALSAQLAPKGAWDPFAFIDACEEAAGRPPSDARQRLLREVQRIETKCLAESLYQRMKDA